MTVSEWGEGFGRAPAQRLHVPPRRRLRSHDQCEGAWRRGARGPPSVPRAVRLLTADGIRTRAGYAGCPSLVGYLSLAAGGRQSRDMSR